MLLETRPGPWARRGTCVNAADLITGVKKIYNKILRGNVIPARHVTHRGDQRGEWDSFRELEMSPRRGRPAEQARAALI
jgi:hypothetical protein